MYLIWLVILFAQSISADIRTTPVPDTTPMIFNRLATAQTSYEAYKMIYYTKVGGYFHLEELSETAIKAANASCNTLPNDQCHILINQLHAQFLNALRDTEEIKAQRKTRAVCEWCGSLQHYLYGTMDANTAREYADHINQIGNETKLQHDLAENQIGLFETFLKSNNKTTAEIENELNRIQNDMNNLSSSLQLMQRSDARTRTLELIQIASEILLEHFYVFSQIDKSLNEVKNHRIPEFIPLKQLTTDLKKVAASLGSHQHLPVDMLSGEPLQIFKYAEITSMLVDEILITEILIPIAEQEIYTLYKVTPIPIDTSNGRLIIKLTEQYFLLNFDQTKFIPLSRAELDRGKMLAHNQMLYAPTSSTQLKYENVCSWKLFMERTLGAAMTACNLVPLVKTDVIITIIENEIYFVSSLNPTPMWEMCNNDQSTQSDVQGRIIINLNPGCSIKTTNYIIKSHKVHIQNSTQLITPELLTSQTTIMELKQLAKIKTSNLNLTEHGAIYIHNREEMQGFIEHSDALVNAARHQFSLNALEYKDNLFDSPLSLGLFSLATISVGVTILLILLKFNVFTTIMSCFKATRQAQSYMVELEAATAGRNEHNSKHYPKTPKSPIKNNKKDSQRDIEISDDEESQPGEY